MRTRILLAIGCAALLSACATATPYQAASENSRGFAEQQLEKDRYRISFAGNSSTDLETVENYMLFRAAELTTENGFDHFIIADRDTEAKTRFIGGSSFGVGSSFHSPFYWSYFQPRLGWVRYHRGFGSRGFHSRGFRSGFGHRLSRNDFSLRQITRYQASAEIVMGRGAKPSDNEKAYGARDILSNLADKIVRPET